MSLRSWLSVISTCLFFVFDFSRWTIRRLSLEKLFLPWKGSWGMHSFFERRMLLIPKIELLFFIHIYIYHYHTVVFVNVKSHVLCEKFSRTGHFFLFNHRQPPFEHCCLSLVARVIMVGCSFFPCVVCAFQALLFNPFYSLTCTCMLAHPPPSETSLWCG